MVLLAASMGGQPEALLLVMTAVTEGTGTHLDFFTLLPPPGLVALCLSGALSGCVLNSAVCCFSVTELPARMAMGFT